MNDDVNGNRILFGKEVSNGKGGKVENYSRIKDGNGRLAQGGRSSRDLEEGVGS